jgi:hypothetical protein
MPRGIVVESRAPPLSSAYGSLPTTAILFWDRKASAWVWMDMSIDLPLDPYLHKGPAQRPALAKYLLP